MQAPTTPSGAPAKEPGERSCPNCGASNGVAAVFCWQCYRPFSAAVPQVASVGVARPGPPSAPPAWTPTSTGSPFPAEPKRSGLTTMAIVVVTTLAVIGGVIFFLNRRGAVALPETFGGMPAIENAQTDLVAETFRGQAEVNGIEGDLAIYGNGVPSAALIWIRDASVPTTDAAFDEFASGFNQGIGANGSLGKKRNEAVSGVTYVCAPVSGATPGTICMWQADDVFWLLFDFSGDPFDESIDLAVASHDAVAAA